MSAPRLGSVVLVLLVAAPFAPAAAPPPTLHLSRWVEQLGSDDEASWRKAADNLWRAGGRALPALRAAAKHRDPDVALRARELLARWDWGIRHGVPRDVIDEIENYRESNRGGKRVAVDRLLRLGAPGFAAAGNLLAREGDADVKKDVAALLKARGRAAARAAIVAGDLGGAENILDAAALSGDAAAVRDRVVFLTLMDRAEAAAESLQRRGESPRLVAQLYRAVGDLERARRLAEKSGDKVLLGGILEEQEDYKALAKLNLPRFRTTKQKGSLLWRAGDQKGFDALLDGLTEANARREIHLFNGRPRDAIPAFVELGHSHAACWMLVELGRHREALALAVPDEKTHAVDALSLLLEQAIAAEQVGDVPRRKKLQASALALAERHLPGRPDFLVGYLRGGQLGGWLDDAVRDGGLLLDANEDVTLSAAVLRSLVNEDAENVALWWEYFRRRKPAPKRSASLRLLVSWFVEGKADKDFDATLAAAREDEEMPARHGEPWTNALVRACVKAGKVKTAEEILKKAAEADTANGYHYLGTFLHGQGRFKEAAAAYQRGLKVLPSASDLLYLRGVALLQADQFKEGHAAIERARLLPLGDDETRGRLASFLDRSGLKEYAAAEYLLLARTADFSSPAAINALTPLALAAAREGRHLDAARYYRRLVATVAFHPAGAFTDPRAYLRLPARAHLHQGRGLIAAGKLDEALQQERLLRAYEPEEPTLAAELVRALDEAGRKADADALFGQRFALFQRACVEYPKFAERHHRLAWFASRTRRRMDLALLHAKRMVELKPKSAVYHDTLAELHFQRGDKAEALAAIKKAAQLESKPDYYEALKKRVEAGDKNAAMPRR